MTETDFDVKLEDAPLDDQMERLEDLLTELKILTSRYKIALINTPDGLMFLDLATQHVIGIDLVAYTRAVGEAQLIDRYDCAHSILDGVWLVLGEDGDEAGEMVEQRTVRNPWPSRER